MRNSDIRQACRRSEVLRIATVRWTDLRRSLPLANQTHRRAFINDLVVAKGV